MTLPNEPDKAPPRPPQPPPKDHDEDDDAPETPPTEPEPVPIEEPPNAPGKRGPYIVDGYSRGHQ